MNRQQHWCTLQEIRARLGADLERETPFSAPDRERIIRYGAPVGCVVEHHEQLARCMDRLRILIGRAESRHTSLASGTVVVADTLLSSSGRFDRIWHAPSGGLWLALAWADTLLPEFGALLPLATGIACCETIRSTGVNAAIRWVNDVHTAGRKLAGILSETFISAVGERYHLIGIGINVNNTEFPRDLAASASSLQAETGRVFDLRQFAVHLLARLCWNFGLVHHAEDCMLNSGEDDPGTAVAPLVARWYRLSDTVGRRVVYGYDVVRRPLYRAMVSGIDPVGGLQLSLEDGSRLTVYSGEIRYLE